MTHTRRTFFKSIAAALGLTALAVSVAYGKKPEAPKVVTPEPVMIRHLYTFEMPPHYMAMPGQSIRLNFDGQERALDIGQVVASKTTENGRCVVTVEATEQFIGFSKTCEQTRFLTSLPLGMPFVSGAPAPSAEDIERARAALLMGEWPT